mmetsp:Transcript_15979/g.39403  ORF Transcript_15979/g.39403 Transcript_15979/m.39403 type:complete len:222 (+) Transcript_15979:183-848(+)
MALPAVASTSSPVLLTRSIAAAIPIPVPVPITISVSTIPAVPAPFPRPGTLTSSSIPRFLIVVPVPPPFARRILASVRPVPVPTAARSFPAVPSNFFSSTFRITEGVFPLFSPLLLVPILDPLHDLLCQPVRKSREVCIIVSSLREKSSHKFAKGPGSLRQPLNNYRILFINVWGKPIPDFFPLHAVSYVQETQHPKVWGLLGFHQQLQLPFRWLQSEQLD